MRERKQSDSPSGYDREVIPIRARHGLTVTQIQHSQAAKLTALNDREIRLTGAALSLQDPRVIAGQVEAAARNLRMGVLMDWGTVHDLADALGAQVLALRLSMARSESERITTGDEAA